MHFKNLLTATNIRQPHYNLAVETAWTQQRGIQHVWTVGCGDNDNTFITFKAIHFHQHLVQCLLTLVVTTTEPGTTLTAHGIDFIDKDDAWSRLFGLLEHVTYPGGTDTDKHFHKVRT